MEGQYACRKDIKEIVKLRTLQQQELHITDFKISIEELVSSDTKFLKEHLNKDFFMQIYKIEKQIVAMCGFQIVKYLPSCDGTTGTVACLCSVYTMPEHRRQGLQKKIILTCLNAIKAKNIQKIELSATNPDAIALYKGLGFDHSKTFMQNY